MKAQRGETDRRSRNREPATPQTTPLGMAFMAALALGSIVIAFALTKWLTATNATTAPRALALAKGHGLGPDVDRKTAASALEPVRPAQAAAEAAVPDEAAKKSHPGMRWIPAGEFTMGTNDPNSMPNERPAHRVRVDGFWIDEQDVTNAQFTRFVDATDYVTMAERKPRWEDLKKELPPGTPKPDDSKLQPGSLVFTPTRGPVPLTDMSAWWRWVPYASWRHPEGAGSTIDGRENHPVVQVSWDDAVAYARWAGKRLPTEAEWEYAARGGLEGKRFCWGDEFLSAGKHMANTYQGQFPVKDTGEDGFIGTSPVRSFPANGYGLYDMAGNVWQWCSDWYREDAHQKSASAGCCLNPLGPSESFDSSDPYSQRRVVKGGSFLCNPAYCESYRPSARRGTPPDTGTSHTGFRCVMAAEGK